MSFQRVVERRLPDGSIGKVYPFHISLEGMESVLLCRDEEDYDVMEKIIFVSALECNTIVVIHIVMSNHAHIGVLALDYLSACRTAESIKRRSSMHLCRKYKERKRLTNSDINVQLLDNEWYVRNAFAYIARNALDTGCRVEDYRWSGYDAMFVHGQVPSAAKAVSRLSRREKESLFHTHADLRGVPWLLDAEGRLIHVSACDWQYLESAYNNDQAFFLKVIGTVNSAQMEEKLVNGPRRRQNDSEFVVTVSDISGRWFQKEIPQLTLEQKMRIIPYLYRCYHTTVTQLARCLQLSVETVQNILKV